jgi:hypothetical protein
VHTGCGKLHTSSKRTHRGPDGATPLAEAPASPAPHPTAPW